MSNSFSTSTMATVPKRLLLGTVIFVLLAVLAERIRRAKHGV